MSKFIHTVESLELCDGGPPRSVGQLCSEIVNQNESICIVTSANPGEPIVELNKQINLKTVPSGAYSLFEILMLKNPFLVKALCELNKEGVIKLIHQHGIWSRFSHAVNRFSQSAEVQFILSPRGMLEPWALKNKKWKKSLAWHLYQKHDLQKTDAFHATARSEAESIRRLGFKQPIAVISNGIELPRLEPKTSNRGNTKPRIRTALFLSRINPKKGLPMLLDAWAQVAPADWRLVIAGNDDSGHLPLIIQKIKELELTDQIEIVGPLFNEEKEKAYLNADLFVLPSYSENFGIVVAEALSYRVPVLTTTGCPWRELQTHDCGWWVEPTLSGIKSGLEAALTTKQERLDEMGMRGRNLVEANYQWHGIAKKMNEFYKWVIDGGERPDFVV